MPRPIARIAAAAVTVAACLSGCAARQMSARTADPLTKVFPACVDAMGDLGYAVMSADKSSGLIVGDKQVGTGESARLNVTVADDAGGSRVVVKYIPPPNATLVGADAAERYVKALQPRDAGLQADVAK